MDTLDPWLELLARFSKRGAELKPGNLQQDMIRHLLDSMEELEVSNKAIEDKLLKLRRDLGDA